MISRWLFLAVAAGAMVSGCSKDDDFVRDDGEAAFGGRNIKFQSTYVYFPSDFSLSIVRDTMPQEDVCAILKRYSSTTPKLLGLPVLPYKEEHYALVVTVDSVQVGDDVSFDVTDTGGAGDRRFAALGHYGIGQNREPDWALRAGGFIRVSELSHYKQVSGKLALRFPSGEKLDEDFSVSACPP
ncbi:MAG TPA: hypothetical protein PKE31_13235 [Pseudomonadota bacterium]|jgi:hypothetical protein|nr:hypothetical protein [Pseudomonadota bacterium]